jgi:flagellar protein FlaG
MTLPIGRFTPYQQFAPAHAAASGPAAGEPQPPQHGPARPAKPGLEAPGTILGDVPPAPTPEARELVARAAEVVQELHENHRELHVSTDNDTGRVIIEVRDLDGNVLKTIPPKHALDILTGDADL